MHRQEPYEITSSKSVVACAYKSAIPTTVFRPSPSLSAPTKLSSTDSYSQVVDASREIMAEEHATLSDEEAETAELRGILSKWTNYIHGWQDRYIVLKDATLSYYRSELESHLGCRGALSLKRATVKPHEFDECRFDVSVNDCVWYLRATSPEEKQQWVDVLESFKTESGYGTSSDSSSGGGPAGGGLRRHSSAASLQSTGSNPERTSRRLTEKLAELETYGQLLGQQTQQLQKYFDLCVATYPTIHDDPSEPIDAVTVADGGALAPVAGEVRESSASFRATCDATLAALQQCAELLRRRERHASHAISRAHRAEELCVALKNQLQDARISSFPGPDLEEGPHSTLPDDEFYDAVETGFDKMEEECCARVAPPSSGQHTRDDVGLPPPCVDNKLTVHPLCPEIERITTEQLSAAFEGVGGEIGWQLFAEEGDMRMYRREVEVDGMVMDPLKAMHRVRGVSARELCHYFYNPRYRHDWETTVEQMTIVEEMSSDTLLVHQTFKRVWPASQRDALFWSHVRAAPDNTYAVVNHSTHHPDYPANTGACLRLIVTVCLACRSTLAPGRPATRDNITTSIAYCSTVNPGGWAPAGVLRAIYKREYPKFLKRFTQYVQDQCRDKPLAY